MSHPVDIIANAIRIADGKHNKGAGEIAVVVARVLHSEPRILEAAVKALIEDGWEQTHEGPNGIGDLSHDDLRNIARTVLRSVSR